MVGEWVWGFPGAFVSAILNVLPLFSGAAAAKSAAKAAAKAQYSECALISLHCPHPPSEDTQPPAQPQKTVSQMLHPYRPP